MKPTPPALADQLLQWFCDEHLIEEIQGDLHEAFYYRLERDGARIARRRYYLDVLAFLRPYAFERYSRTKQFLPMLDNHFKIAARNLMHRRGFTVLNLLGLSLGLTAVMLTGLYLRYEYTFDEHIADHDRIFRLHKAYRDQVYTCMSFSDYYDSDEAAQMALPDRLESYEEVEQATHFVLSSSQIMSDEQYFLYDDDRRFVIEDFLITNRFSEFEAIFSQTYLLGNPQEVLAQPNSIVLTASEAERWYGADWHKRRLVGKDLKLEEDNYTLAAVIADPAPNTHFQFTLLLTQAQIPCWAAYTYAKVKPEVTMDRLLANINRDADLVYPGYREDELNKGIQAIALTDIHGSSGNLYELRPTANHTYLSTFALVAIILLVLMWTNYTNLALAMYTDRQRELGVRRVLGARPQDVGWQVLAESICLAILSIPLVLLLSTVLLPYFNELMGVALSLYTTFSLFLLLGLVLFTGLLSGLYPAIQFGRKAVLQLMTKGRKEGQVQWPMLTRKLLTGIQFLLVVAVLSVTVFIYQQMRFVQERDLGFEEEGVVFFSINGAEQYQPLKNTLMQLPAVQSVGANGIPGAEMFNQLTYTMKEATQIFSDGINQYVGTDALLTLGVDCKHCPMDWTERDQLFLINETAANKLAQTLNIEPTALIGEVLVSEPEWENEEFGYGIHKVIDGIVTDYQYFSMKHPHQPMFIDVQKKPAWVYEVMVRLETDDLAGTLMELADAYVALAPGMPFRYNFLSNRLESLYKDEQRSGTLLSVLSLLAIVLAVLGLAGVIAYIARQRQQEMSIRKVLGASARQILYTFQSDFVPVFVMAAVLALPIVWYLTEQWLSNFAFRIQPQFWIAIFISLMLMLLMFVVIAWRTRQVVLDSPVETLRNS